MKQDEITMTLAITRTIVKTATPEILLAILNDDGSKINQARKKMLAWAGKSEFGGKEMIEQRRDELIAVIDICEPLLAQFADDTDV